jgi:hypothetical protein
MKNCPWEYADPKEQGGKCVVCCMDCGSVLKIPCANDPKTITGCRLGRQLRQKIKKPWLHNLGDHVAVMLAKVGITKERWAKLRGRDPAAGGCTPCQQRQEALNDLGKAVSDTLQ